MLFLHHDCNVVMYLDLYLQRKARGDVVKPRRVARRGREHIEQKHFGEEGDASKTAPLQFNIPCRHACLDVARRQHRISLKNVFATVRVSAGCPAEHRVTYQHGTLGRLSTPSSSFPAVLFTHPVGRHLHHGGVLFANMILSRPW